MATPAVEAAAPAPGLRKLEVRPTRPPPATVVALSPQDQQFAQKLREKFALHIGEKHAQIKLIEQVLAYLKAQGFDRDLDRAYALLKGLFPDLADALFAKLQGLIAYDDWLEQNRATLAQMDPSARRQALWDARKQLFGDDASEIWAGELRNDKLRASLEELQNAPQLTTREKLDKYVTAVQETYGERAPEVIERSRTELLDSFMELESVQEELNALPAAERRENLRQIRGAMGMDDAAIQRWDALDRARDQAWDVGQRYLRERAQLTSQYPAVEQEQRLRELQDRLFGEEAETIRAEEAAGFQRFGHRRRFGRE